MAKTVKLMTQGQSKTFQNGLISILALQQGDDPCVAAKFMADIVDQAKATIHIAIYSFSLTGMAKTIFLSSLQRATARGVHVQIASHKDASPETPNMISTDPYLSKLVRKEIDAKSNLMHNKYLIVDALTSNAMVVCGSANFTNEAWGYQENNILCFKSPALSQYYMTDFNQMWMTGLIDNSGYMDSGTVMVGSTEVTVDFSPGDSTMLEGRIASIIGNAKQRIAVSSMVLSSAKILAGLSDNRAVPSVGLYDSNQMGNALANWAGSAKSKYKADLFATATRGFVGKPQPKTMAALRTLMHNKVAVGDNMVATGSYNFSNNAMSNAENILIIKDAEIADFYTQYITAIVGRYKTGS